MTNLSTEIKIALLGSDLRFVFDGRNSAAIYQGEEVCVPYFQDTDLYRAKDSRLWQAAVILHIDAVKEALKEIKNAQPVWLNDDHTVAEMQVREFVYRAQFDTETVKWHVYGKGYTSQSLEKPLYVKGESLEDEAIARLAWWVDKHM